MIGNVLEIQKLNKNEILCKSGSRKIVEDQSVGAYSQRLLC